VYTTVAYLSIPELHVRTNNEVQFKPVLLYTPFSRLNSSVKGNGEEHEGKIHTNDLGMILII
jgi:hypothetical protein